MSKKRNPEIVFAYPRADDCRCTLPGVNARYVVMQVNTNVVAELAKDKTYGGLHNPRPTVLVKSKVKNVNAFGTWLIFDLSNGDGCNLPNAEHRVYAWACATLEDAKKLRASGYLAYDTTPPEFYFEP